MKNVIRIIDGNNMFHYWNSRCATFEALCDKLILLGLEYDPSKTIWVFDGYDSRAKRRAIYPEYKQTAARKAKPSQSNYLETYENLGEFKRILQNQGDPILELERTEADDIIGYLTEHYLKDSSNRVEIYSTDRDFWSLAAKGLVSLPYSSQLEAVTPADMLLYKSLVGDSSDNIKGIKLFGDVSFKKLTTQEKSDLLHALQNGLPCPIEALVDRWHGQNWLGSW